MSSRAVIAQIKAEIAALKRQDGSLAPIDLVRWAAENPESELHQCFQWDNQEAAHQHRLFQARQLIGRYAVEYDLSQQEPVEIPYISVPSRRNTGEGSYLARDPVAANVAYRAEVLAEQQAKLRTMAATFGPILPELKTVWSAIKRAC